MWGAMKSLLFQETSCFAVGMSGVWTPCVTHRQNTLEPDFPVAWSLAHLHKLTALAHSGPDYEEFLHKVQGVDS
jgi:hypothetical protein